jgi:putative transcriptional regulator
MDSLKGQLLIATPNLSDPNFFHTVVLMIQHSADGALGLVLNRPTATAVSKVWAQVSESTCLIEGFLHQGGPCEGPLMVVHTAGDASDLPVSQGVHFTTNKDAIQRLVETGAEPTRFFIGYAGWGEGQLEAEITSGSWLTVTPSIADIFDTNEDLWHELFRKSQRDAKANWIPRNMMPDDPSLN